jgi:1-aminocyclopropane-1-carboxylate deaminase
VEHFLIILLLWPRRQENGLKTIGIIRGDELEQNQLNSTLLFAQSCGMQLEFISREDYKRKMKNLLSSLKINSAIFSSLREALMS